MAIDLRTHSQKKWDQVKKQIISLYDEMSDLSESNWRKANGIAEKLGVSAGFVAEVIRQHNESRSINA